MAKAPNVSLGFLLSDITRLFRKHFDRRATPYGLTRAQWRALKWLNAGEGMNQSELAEQLEMEPIAIGRVIDRLQSAGFVERRPDPADRRSWRLFLTDQARDVLNDVEEISRGLRSEAVHGIRAADLRLATTVLEQIKANLLALDVRPEKGGGK